MPPAGSPAPEEAAFSLGPEPSCVTLTPAIASFNIHNFPSRVNSFPFTLAARYPVIFALQRTAAATGPLKVNANDGPVKWPAPLTALTPAPSKGPLSARYKESVTDRAGPENVGA